MLLTRPPPSLSVEASLRKLATQRAGAGTGDQQCARHLTRLCTSHLIWPSWPHFAETDVYYNDQLE